MQQPQRYKQRLLLLHGRPEWDGDDHVDVSGVRVRVGTAVSPLALRDLITRETYDRLVVLTDVDETEIGPDLLSLAIRQRVNSVDTWDTVRAAFGVSATAIVDGSVAREGEVLARALLDKAPPGGWPPPPSGVLTREHAYRSLVEATLGLKPRQLDAAGLLDWTLEPAGVLALHDMEETLRSRVVSWLLQHTGAATRPVLDLVANGHGTDAVPLGVVAGILWTVPGAARSQGWVDQKVGRPLTAGEAKDWSELSEGWVERRLVSDPEAARGMLERAEQLMDEVHATQHVATSHLLPGGLQARARDAAEAAAAASSSATPVNVERAESAFRSLGRHRLAALGHKDVEAVAMAVRLVRWLATNPSAPVHAQGALAWQVAEGGWVDAARQVVANGADDAVVAGHLRAVHEAATTRRGAIDAAAAGLVATAVEDDQPFGELVPVEDALTRLVAPLAGESPVLLLVLDGMSAAVANEVVASAVGLGWVEHVAEGSERRTVLMAGLPTVTEVSRTSLVTGRLQRGGQREERDGLRAVVGVRSRLFHLRDLEARPGQDLPDEVREAVQDTSVSVVAAVLNAVDDSLSGGDPGRTRWDVAAVRHLQALLERARAAGRVVVLTSDHGHVVDDATEGELRSASGGGARWRPFDGQVANDEVRLRGRRVVLGDGDVVAAVKETLRYRARSEGYHGGAALAEMAIPFVVLARRGESLPGWTPAGDRQPTWWTRPAEPDLRSEDVQAPGLFG
ncbi:BREX-2 system phosphatase PglZ [Nocardioides jiangsuensis]|uniref:BREX-2 system phosphatase PglZ n=1 Tax=Nocardioides jiangsuensis TaxID=2866161 RepID=UPI0027E31BB2|nr:BREX-2 system phosphatase PglZ [Nocardioides jiangsuensis]